ncbi:phosphatase PAP2 family protein [Microbacterium sp. NPDC091313]
MSRLWPVWALLLFALTFSLGFAAKTLAPLRLSVLDVDVNAVNSPVLDGLALVLDVLDRPVVVALILVVAFVALLPRRGWRIALGACAATGLGWMTTLVVKAVVAQPRPAALPLAHAVPVDPATLSYPSGHVVFVAALTTAVVVALRSIRGRAIAGIVGALITLAVGWSRLYVGVHFATDVIGGVVNGIAGALLFAGLWNVLAARVWRHRAPHAA